MRPYARQIHVRAPVDRQSAARRGGPALGLLFLGALTTVRSVAAPLSVTVLLPDGRPLAGAIVTAEPTSGPAHPAAPVTAVMDQVNKAFEPDLMVVPVNSTVSFPNSDTVSHQIYSFSAPKRFQLPLYRGKPYPPVLFDSPGIVTLGCNIHDEMLAYVVVTDAPFFGRTAPNGTWSAEAPGGAYRINIWHPRIRDEDQDLHEEIKVTEPAGGTLRLRLKKLLKPEPLEGRPHSWDSY
jgi:plastocyanin